MPCSRGWTTAETTTPRAHRSLVEADLRVHLSQGLHHPPHVAVVRQVERRKLYVSRYPQGIQASGVYRAGAPESPYCPVAFTQQKLGQISAARVLKTGIQRDLRLLLLTAAILAENGETLVDKLLDAQNRISIPGAARYRRSSFFKAGMWRIVSANSSTSL